MLSRFDLKDGHAIEAFRGDYAAFCEQMIERGLAVSTSKVGRRILNTQMDTDIDDAPEYYAVMMFRDREQLDLAYAYIADGSASEMDLAAHKRVNDAVENPVFTCWEDNL